MVGSTNFFIWNSSFCTDSSRCSTASPHHWEWKALSERAEKIMRNQRSSVCTHTQRIIRMITSFIQTWPHLHFLLQSCQSEVLIMWNPADFDIYFLSKSFPLKRPEDFRALVCQMCEKSLNVPWESNLSALSVKFLTLTDWMSILTIAMMITWLLIVWVC